MEKLCDLFFEFSNEDRLRILYRLRDEPSTVTSLSRDLGLTTQETSRHLSRLGEIGLTLKEPDGTHSLTPYGDLSLAQISGFRFTCAHSEYMKSHRLTGLPQEFIARIGELENSVYTDDVMVIFHRVEQTIKAAEEYVLRLTDRYIITVVPTWEEALGRGVEFRLLDPRNIVIPPEFNRGPVLTEALISGQFVNKTLESVDIFLAISEKEVAGICFPGLDGRMDYRGFHSDDPGVHRWAKDLYEYFWERSKPRAIS
ncbi:MAG: ArsR family transcriptional regulator [Candidatus Bathyarchaeota archaeon]